MLHTAIAGSAAWAHPGDRARLQKPGGREQDEAVDAVGAALERRGDCVYEQRSPAEAVPDLPRKDTRMSSHWCNEAKTVREQQAAMQRMASV